MATSSPTEWDDDDAETLVSSSPSEPLSPTHSEEDAQAAAEAPTATNSPVNCGWYTDSEEDSDEDAPAPRSPVNCGWYTDSEESSDDEEPPPSPPSPYTYVDLTREEVMLVTDEPG